ncbi:hypothetical protein HYDPIDRAFT_107683 [Hydnomerulius pinastri MD-312]|nr:hypothetical protein HYDPIDRAFT_107683 [Hydnomerulius pinastri MD-312]
MACSISGAGEHITRAGLARSIGGAVRAAKGSQRQHDPEVDVRDLLARTLAEHLRTRGEPSPNAGVLLMTKEAQEDSDVIARLWCAFTTESMAIAYASSEKPVPKVCNDTYYHVSPMTALRQLFHTDRRLHIQLLPHRHLPFTSPLYRSIGRLRRGRIEARY